MNADAQTQAATRRSFSPGDIYRTMTTFELADGTKLGERRGLIIWDAVEHVDRRDPQTNESEWTLLVTWASTNFVDRPDKPAGEPFEITNVSGGWVLAEQGSVSGHIECRVGRYKASDPQSNSIEIMTTHYRTRLAVLARHRARRMVNDQEQVNT